jgi:uncharacterized small protein (DUF1192 family)
MVRDSFWTDSYIERLTPDEKLLFVYLLTNPQCNIAGVFELRSKRIAFETGYDIEVVENILGRFARDSKVFLFEDWIVLINSPKHQNIRNEKIQQGIKRIFEDELPTKLKEAMRSDESYMSHCTLLYSTLLNSTLPYPKEEKKVVVEKKDEDKKIGTLIGEVIKLFESIDPKNKKYYNNPTQRAACDFLLSEYGLEEIKKRIEVLPKTNTMPYFPNITTPCQLRDKWVTLNNQIERHKAEQGAKSNLVAF